MQCVIIVHTHFLSSRQFVAWVGSGHLRFWINLERKGKSRYIAQASLLLIHTQSCLQVSNCSERQEWQLNSPKVQKLVMQLCAENPYHSFNSKDQLGIFISKPHTLILNA